MDTTHLLQQYGPVYFPWVVFVCALFENDVTFVMAGIYASTVHHRIVESGTLGAPHPSLVFGVLAGVMGALCHDSFWFFLGHHRSKWIKKTKAWRNVGPQIEQWAARFGALELFFCRFIPGTRVTSQLFWGVQRLKLWKFYLIESSGLAIWATTLTFLGYRFSLHAQSIMGKVKQRHLTRYLLLTLVLTALIYYGVRVFTRHEIVKRGTPPEDPRAD